MSPLLSVSRRDTEKLYQVECRDRCTRPSIHPLVVVVVALE